MCEGHEDGYTERHITRAGVGSCRVDSCRLNVADVGEAVRVQVNETKGWTHVI